MKIPRIKLISEEAPDNLTKLRFYRMNFVVKKYDEKTRGLEIRFKEIRKKHIETDENSRIVRYELNNGLYLQHRKIWHSVFIPYEVENGKCFWFPFPVLADEFTEKFIELFEKFFE